MQILPVFRIRLRNQEPYDSEDFVPPRSASGSVSQRDGSMNPDPHQDPYENVKASVDGGGGVTLRTRNPLPPTPPTHSAFLFINNLKSTPSVGDLKYFKCYF